MSFDHPFSSQTAPDVPNGEAASAPNMRDADVAQLEALQAVAMTFATWLHRKGAEQIEQGGEKAAGEIRQLSHSFNRAARAVRQIVVLKHEVAELRPLPGSRPATPANQNVRSDIGNKQGGGRSRRPWERSDLHDYDDEEREVEEEVRAWLEKLLTALQVDIEAAGPEMVAEAARESTAAKLSTIAARIPHPTLDACLADIEMRKLWRMFAPQNLRNRAQGPPSIRECLDIDAHSLGTP